MDVWQATRDTASGPFTNVAPLSELNSSADDSGAALPADGRELFFVSERAGQLAALARAARMSGAGPLNQYTAASSAKTNETLSPASWCRSGGSAP